MKIELWHIMWFSDLYTLFIWTILNEALLYSVWPSILWRFECICVNLSLKVTLFYWPHDTFKCTRTHLIMIIATHYKRLFGDEIHLPWIFVHWVMQANGTNNILWFLSRSLMMTHHLIVSNLSQLCHQVQQC